STAVNTRTCFYEDCSGAGRSSATCSGGVWNVITGPCTSTICTQQVMTCPAGQICMESAGGALLVTCVPNTCGKGPIQCSCLQSCFGDCVTTGSVNGGVTVYCNTCPSNTCA